MIFLVKEMMEIHDGNVSLEKIVQKSLHYPHHQSNYKDGLASGLMLLGLKISKSPAIETVTDNFDLKWKNILHNAEMRLVELLLMETCQVLLKIEMILRIKPEMYILMVIQKQGHDKMKNFSTMRTL